MYLSNLIFFYIFYNLLFHICYMWNTVLYPHLHCLFIPTVVVQYPSKDCHPRVPSRLPFSHHQISSLLKEDHRTRAKQIPHFNQARTKLLQLPNQKFIPVQSQKDHRKTQQLSASGLQKMSDLLPYLDNWKMAKSPILQNHHYMATVLPSIYHEYNVKGIPLSLLSLE